MKEKAPRAPKAGIIHVRTSLNLQGAVYSSIVSVHCVQSVYGTVSHQGLFKHICSPVEDILSPYPPILLFLTWLILYVCSQNDPAIIYHLGCLIYFTFALVKSVLPSGISGPEIVSAHPCRDWKIYLDSGCE